MVGSQIYYSTLDWSWTMSNKKKICERPDHWISFSY